MKSALLLWFLASSLAAQTAAVVGAVVDKTTGEPIAGAHVRLIPSSAISDQTFERVYGAISDRAGHYSIAEIQPGGYFIVTERSGYVGGFTGNTLPAMIQLKAGDHSADHKVEMVKTAHLSGRVLDENGDPVERGDVRVSQATGNGNPAGGNTNDRGEFRIAVGPGRYYLQVSPMQQFNNSVEIRNGSPVAPYSPTYYPSATARTDAGVVEVAPGQEAAGLDIRLTRDTTAGHFFTVSGVVNGIPANSSAMVILASGDSPTALRSSQGSGTRTDGVFSFHGLGPKYYRLSAQYSTGKARMQSPAIEFHLTADQTNVQLALQPADDLAGKLEFIGGSLPAGKKPVVFFDYDNHFEGTPSSSAETAVDGTFRAAGMFTATYKVRVESLPDNAYVKSISLDGASIEGDAIDLSHGVKNASLKITVALNGGQLSGKILGHDGEPLNSPLAVLLCWKDPKKTEPESERIAGNEYKLKGLRPGKIRVLAVDFLEFAGSANTSGDELSKAALAVSQEIEIKDGDHVVKDLKVVDKEKLNVSAK